MLQGPQIHPALTQRVQQLLPTARIERFSLKDAGLELYLMNEDYPRGRLPDEVALALMEQPFYWAFCWASGAVLAEYIARHPELVVNKRILDFGCGSGVVAIAAALAGAAEVVACDMDDAALQATEANAVLNQAVVKLCSDFDDVAGHIDLILVADVLYDRANFPWLSRFLGRASNVLIADSRVRAFDFPGYRYVADYEGCTLPDLDESAEFRRVKIYEGSARLLLF